MHIKLLVLVPLLLLLSSSSSSSPSSPALWEELKLSEGMRISGEGAADLRALGSNWVKEGPRATG